MKQFFITTILIIAIAFSSCNSTSNGSDKFIGTWKDVKSNSTFTIKKIGKNFTVSNELGTYPATYNKQYDKLELNADLRTFDFIYDPSTKHIIVDGSEAEKISD